MAQINYSREKLENMSQRTIKQAQAILEKYSKDKNASPADRQGWEATSQQLDDVHAKIDQAWNLAKSYGIDFEGKSKDLLTLAEIHQLMSEQIHDKGASAAKVGNIMDQINDLPVGASEKAKFQAWAKDKNLSGKLATGLLGFGIAETALHALGVGQAAIAAGTATTSTGALLGTILPHATSFLGSTFTTLFSGNPIGFLAIAIPLTMKAWPHVKSFINKHNKSKANNFAAELDQISAQNKDGVRKQKETPSQEKENQNAAGQLSDLGVEPSDFEKGLQEYNAIEDGMDKLAELQGELDGLVSDLQGEAAELESCYRRNSRNPKQLEAEAEEHKIEIKKIEQKINDTIQKIKEAKNELNQISAGLSAKQPKTKKIQAFIENFQSRIDDKNPEAVAETKKIVDKYEEVHKQAIANEAADKKKEEEARKAAEEAKRKEEEARKAKEEAAKKEEEAKKAKEEAERKAKEEEARKAAEEAARKEEEARKAKEEAERKAAEEAERKAKEEAERKAIEEAARKAKEDAARKAAEEAARKEEEARKAAEEEARKKTEEEARKAAEEEARKKAEEEAGKKGPEEDEGPEAEEKPTRDYQAGIDANVQSAVDDLKGSLNGATNSDLKRHLDSIEKERAAHPEFSALFDVTESIIEGVRDERTAVSENGKGKHGQNPVKSNAPYIENAAKKAQEEAQAKLAEELGAQKE